MVIGTPDSLVDVINDGSTCCVVENGRTSDWFALEKGVKQGCVMSGFLFNIIIDWVTTDHEEHHHCMERSEMEVHRGPGGF